MIMYREGEPLHDLQTYLGPGGEGQSVEVSTPPGIGGSACLAISGVHPDAPTPRLHPCRSASPPRA